MKPLEPATKYLETLGNRSKVSRVYQSHQELGLELAEILSDREHKALYMKLAKTHQKSMLLSLAKSVAEKKDIKRPGAYFMRLLSNAGKEKKTGTLV